MWLVNAGGLLLIALIVWWFWLYKPGELRAEELAIVVVDNGSYQPGRIRIVANQASSLAFERRDPSPCAEMVLFPDLDISRTLTLNKVTLVPLPPLAAGEYPFHCQMQMYRGVLLVS